MTTVGDRSLPALPGETIAEHFARALAESLLPGGPHGTPTVTWTGQAEWVVVYSGGSVPQHALRVNVEEVVLPSGDEEVVG